MAKPPLPPSPRRSGSAEKKKASSLPLMPMLKKEEPAMIGKHFMDEGEFKPRSYFCADISMPSTQPLVHPVTPVPNLIMMKNFSEMNKKEGGAQKDKDKDDSEEKSA